MTSKWILPGVVGGILFVCTLIILPRLWLPETLDLRVRNIVQQYADWAIKYDHMEWQIIPPALIFSDAQIKGVEAQAITIDLNVFPLFSGEFIPSAVHLLNVKANQLFPLQINQIDITRMVDQQWRLQAQSKDANYDVSIKPSSEQNHLSADGSIRTDPDIGIFDLTYVVEWPAYAVVGHGSGQFNSVKSEVSGEYEITGADLEQWLRGLLQKDESLLQRVLTFQKPESFAAHGKYRIDEHGVNLGFDHITVQEHTQGSGALKIQNHVVNGQLSFQRLNLDEIYRILSEIWLPSELIETDKYRFDQGGQVNVDVSADETKLLGQSAGAMKVTVRSAATGYQLALSQKFSDGTIWFDGQYNQVSGLTGQIGAEAVGLNSLLQMTSVPFIAQDDRQRLYLQGKFSYQNGQLSFDRLTGSAGRSQFICQDCSWQNNLYSLKLGLKVQQIIGSDWQAKPVVQQDVLAGLKLLKLLDQLNIDASVSVGHWKINQNVDLSQFLGRIELKDGHLHLQNMSAQDKGGGSVQVNLQSTMEIDPELNVQAKMTVPAQSGLARQWKLTGVQGKVMASAQAKGKLSDFDLDIKMKDDMGSFQTAGKLGWSPARSHADLALKMNAGSEKIIAGFMQDFYGWSIQNAGPVNIDAHLQQGAEGNSVTLKQFSIGSGQISGEVQKYNNGDVKIQAALKNIELQHGMASTGQQALAPAKFQLKCDKCKINQGIIDQISINAAIQPKSTSTVDLTAKTQQLTKSFHGFPFEGDADLHVQASATGQSWSDILKNMEGQGQIQAQQLKLLGYNMPLIQRRLAQQDGAVDIGALYNLSENAGETPFSSAVLPFQITKGAVTFNQATLPGDGYGVRLLGGYNMAMDALDLKAIFQIQQPVALPDLTLHMAAELASPVITVDYQEIADALIGLEFKRLAQQKRLPVPENAE